MTREILKKDIAKIILSYISKGYGREELYRGDDLYNYSEEEKEIVMDMFEECIDIGTKSFEDKYENSDLIDK